MSLNSDYEIVDGFDRMDFDRVTEMLSNGWWGIDISSDEVIQCAKNSALIVGAFTTDGLQIGYARVISDKIRFAYIVDVFVDQPYRGIGIGQSMIRYILNHPELKDMYQWLLSTRDAHGVYSKVGFKGVEFPDMWMEIREPKL